MFNKAAVLAAGFAAVARAAPLPQAQTTVWSSVWASQLASMASVESTMGQPAAATAAASSAVATTAASVATASPFGGVNHEVAGFSSSAAAAVTTVTPIQTIEITPTTAAAATTATTAGTATQMPKQDAAAANGPAVTNSAAWNSQDSTGPTPTDTYKCYGTPGSAPPSAFPPIASWGAFEALYQQNYQLLQEGCANLGYSPNNNDQQIGWIHDAIVEVGGDAAVDPRFILAVVMQESHGCLAVGTTSNGVTNPGLMQSHNGSHWVGNSASASAQQASIVQMIRDGTQGTQYGNGLVQEINEWGNDYTAARGYNSGDGGVTASNLNLGNGATASYVNDIANRLTGWVFNPGTSPSCPGES